MAEQQSFLEGLNYEGIFGEFSSNEETRPVFDHEAQINKINNLQQCRAKCFLKENL